MEDTTASVNRASKGTTDSEKGIVVSVSQNVQKVQEPYKEIEYQRFMKIVENGEIPEHWEMLAEALGVHRNTINKWKNLPEFQKALSKGIDRSISEMEHVGKRDWKMWRERLAMLRKEKAQEQTVTINGENIIAILGNVKAE